MLISAVEFLEYLFLIKIFEIQKFTFQREIIQLYVGQFGVQLASACWELFCLEHGILADGTFCDYDDTDNDSSALFGCYHCPRSNYFRCVPRVVLVDSEPTCIDEIRTGCYKDLFDPTSLISGKEDAASNFGKGYYDIADQILDKTLEKVRRVAEDCDYLQVKY